MAKFNRERTLIVVALEQELPKSLIPEWNVCYTGVGKINSIINVQQAVTCHSPTTLINYGSAGAINQALSGLHEVTKFEQRDMDARGLGFKIGETPFDPISSINLGRPGLSCGTGDNFVIEGECLSTDLVDMEAYALAKVCYLRDIPFVSFKYITDGADEQEHEDW